MLGFQKSNSVYAVSFLVLWVFWKTNVWHSVWTVSRMSHCVWSTQDLPSSQRLSVWNTISARTGTERRWCWCRDCEVLLQRFWIRGSFLWSFSLWLPSPRVWRLRRTIPVRLERCALHGIRFQGHPEHRSILQDGWRHEDRQIWFGLQCSVPLHRFAMLCHWEISGDYGPSSAYAPW